MKLSVLQALFDDGVNADDVTTLCRAVVHFKDAFEDPSAFDRSVLTSFAVVAVEVIAAKGSCLNRANVFLAWKAGKILMKFLMSRMTTSVKDEDGGAAALKKCVGPLTSFCAGSSLLKRDDCDAILTTLKKNVDKLPDGLLIDDDADAEAAVGEAASSSADVSSTETLTLAEQTRPQTDLVSFSCRICSLWNDLYQNF